MERGNEDRRPWTHTIWAVVKGVGVVAGIVAAIVGTYVGIRSLTEDDDSKSNEPPSFNGFVKADTPEAQSFVGFLREHDAERVRLEVKFSLPRDDVDLEGDPRDDRPRIHLWQECVGDASPENPLLAGEGYCSGTQLVLNGKETTDSTLGLGSGGFPVLSGYFGVTVLSGTPMGIGTVLLKPLEFRRTF
jgi:hypothetical protein